MKRVQRWFVVLMTAMGLIISISALAHEAPAGEQAKGKGTAPKTTQAKTEGGQGVLPTYDWRLPGWAPAPPVPADNPMSAAKVELGRRLFYDKRLSADRSMSCATCHEQDKAFTDGRAYAVGVTGEVGARSPMMLANVAYMPVLTWGNPNLKRLEIQALLPIFGDNPVEMGMAGKEQELFRRLRADARYPAMFRAAFPELEGEVNLSTITMALAAFQRSLISFNSPYDRYKYGGEINAISDSAKRGEDLFFGEKFECAHCHGGLNFTDNVQHEGLAYPELGFHNTGLYNLDGKGGYPTDNPGIRQVTGDPADEGKFRTPSLRNIALTAPYMHDGSIPTLTEVIRDHYAKQGKAVHDGKKPNPLRSPFITGFEVTDQEVQDLVAFLESLTDWDFVTDPRFSDPFAAPAGPFDGTPAANGPLTAAADGHILISTFNCAKR